MASVLSRLMPRRTLALALAIGLVGAGVGVVSAAKPITCTASPEGTYLASGTIVDQTGTLVLTGSILTFAAGGSISITRQDNNTTLVATQTDGQGTWTCTGTTVMARAFDFYRETSPDLFELDRYDYALTLNAGVLTGTVVICAWSMPADPAVVRVTTTAECLASQNGVTFFGQRPVTAARVTP